MTGFQRLCLVTCVMVLGLIILGGVVRATESGLGCPDWPRCHGSFIPKWEKHTLIEYSHRFVASGVGLMVLGIAAWAWRSYKTNRAVLYPSLALVFLVLLQGTLGGITVLRELSAPITALHLGTALVIFAILLALTVAAFATERPLPRPRVSGRLARLTLAVGLGTLVLMVWGSYISGESYGLACAGWPLCNGKLVPEANALSVSLNFGHRLLAFLLGLLVLGLVYQAWRERAASALVFSLAVAAGLLYALQVGVGAANALSHLAAEFRAAHLAVGTLLWAVVTVMNIRLHELHEVPRRSPGERVAADADLLRVAR